MKCSKYADLVLWVDRDWENSDKELGVKAVETIVGTDYDYLVIAIDSKRTADKIKTDLLQMGVPEHKIVWEEYRKNRNC